MGSSTGNSFVRFVPIGDSCTAQISMKNHPRIHGTDVPVEEPSTASETEVDRKTDSEEGHSKESERLFLPQPPNLNPKRTVDLFDVDPVVLYGFN